MQPQQPSEMGAWPRKQGRNRFVKENGHCRCVGELVLGSALVTLGPCVVGLSGCAPDRAYKQELTWTNAPVVHVFTNAVVTTKRVPVVVNL